MRTGTSYRYNLQKLLLYWQYFIAFYHSLTLDVRREILVKELTRDFSTNNELYCYRRGSLSPPPRLLQFNLSFTTTAGLSFFHFFFNLFLYWIVISNTTLPSHKQIRIRHPPQTIFCQVYIESFFSRVLLSPSSSKRFFSYTSNAKEMWRNNLSPFTMH